MGLPRRLPVTYLAKAAAAAGRSRGGQRCQPGTVGLFRICPAGELYSIYVGNVRSFTISRMDSNRGVTGSRDIRSKPICRKHGHTCTATAVHAASDTRVLIVLGFRVFFGPLLSQKHC
eukprot:jgi/Botrbrau1/13321/Bobra.0334s0001.1